LPWEISNDDDYDDLVIGAPNFSWGGNPFRYGLCADRDAAVPSVGLPGGDYVYWRQ
jgi:hypothetical protein